MAEIIKLILRAARELAETSNRNNSRKAVVVPGVDNEPKSENSNRSRLKRKSCWCTWIGQRRNAVKLEPATTLNAVIESCGTWKKFATNGGVAKRLFATSCYRSKTGSKSNNYQIIKDKQQQNSCAVHREVSIFVVIIKS